jgi:ubiquinone/menaquinone biosynthesis C-methylase UbiE
MLDIEKDLDLDERSHVDFVANLRKSWANTVFPALYSDVAASQAPVENLEKAEAAVHESVMYPWFSHLERQQQKMMWRTMSDAVLRRHDSLESLLAVTAPQSSSLETDSDFELPQWYVDTDIHIQPGSFFMDEASAFIYELGARVVMLRDNDGYKFHRLFAETALPDLPNATRVVDVGCGFGKSTQVLTSKYPTAEVIGVDLSAPNLRLAHAQSEGKHSKIRWKQAASYSTGLEANSVDLVTGTMVLHEMPQEQIEATLREAVRILRPGGIIRFLEFWPTGDHVRDVTVYEHAERNNEPYFHDLFATDAPKVLESVGTPGAEWVPFDEREVGLTPAGRLPRSDWHFPWAVLSATKPE